MEKQNSLILLDSDVISHFITNQVLTDLPRILAPHSCVVLDYVYNEVSRHTFRKAFLDSMIGKGIEKWAFPNNDESVKREFALIRKLNPIIGDGERACMAVAKYGNNIIASSNFRDIVPYCKANNIHYLGTLDILIIACNKGIYDEATCDHFISEAIKINNARFPKGVTQIKFYQAPDLSFI